MCSVSPGRVKANFVLRHRAVESIKSVWETRNLHLFGSNGLYT